MTNVLNVESRTTLARRARLRVSRYIEYSSLCLGYKRLLAETLNAHFLSTFPGTYSPSRRHGLGALLDTFSSSSQRCRRYVHGRTEFLLLPEKSLQVFNLKSRPTLDLERCYCPVLVQECLADHG